MIMTSGPCVKYKHICLGELLRDSGYYTRFLVHGLLASQTLNFPLFGYILE